MQNVTFYFDPSCPFSWITSRWLSLVEKNRDVSIKWVPFSLALKNGELLDAGNDVTPHGEGHRGSHKILRVMQAIHDEGGLNLGTLYSVFGKLHFIDGHSYGDALLNIASEEIQSSLDMSACADDESYDEALQGYIDDATAVAGQDIGVPTIIFEMPDGSSGYFGPVLQSLPDEEDGLKLWDGLCLLATDKHFYELKRGRPSGGPDVMSTARVFE